MAYIRVNHREMQNAADQIENYIARLDKNMANIETAVLSLGTEWKGEDYQQLKVESSEINATGSTTDKMRTSLKNYAASIREASKLYKEAQARAINRASTLCR